MKISPLIIFFGGLIALVLVYAVIGAVRGLFSLLTTVPFLTGLLVGVGISALAGHRILLRNRELEGQKRLLEETVDNFLQREGAL